VEDDRGPISGLRFGYDLFRHNIGTSLVAWLMSIVLGIGAGIASFILVLIVLAVLAVIGFVVYTGVAFTTALFIYIGVAVLIFWIITLIVNGFVNAFFNQYWTFVYLNLTGRVNNLFEVIQPSPPAAPAELPEDGESEPPMV
jgi:amino acid transporter